MHAIEFLKSAAVFLAVLSALVIAHEWGHYIVAKLCKMRVDDFSLFFGPRLIRLGKRNGTEYNIRCIPLGGFVKIAGMEPEDMATGASIIGSRDGEKKGVPSRAEYDKTLLGLKEEALEKVNFAEVSDRVLKAVSDAITEDSRLSEAGKEDLKALLLTSSLTTDEHAYIEAILGVDQFKPDPDGYNQKPLWQRAAVIFAGPFMSLFFGYAIFCIMGFTTGLPALDETKATNVIQSIIKNKPANRAGLMAGDKIVAINDLKITDGEQMVNIIHSSIKYNPVTKAQEGVPLLVEWNRPSNPNEPGSKSVSFTKSITPEVDLDDVPEGGKTVKKPQGHLGFAPLPEPPTWIHYSPSAAIVAGSKLIYFEVTGTLKTLFSKQVGENVGGIVSIAGVINQQRQEGADHIFYVAGMLSVSLGIINLFPIPVLDGGHLMLLAWEGLRRRRLSSREVYGAQMIGLCIIGVLFVLVMYKDISRLITNR